MNRIGRSTILVIAFVSILKMGLYFSSYSINTDGILGRSCPRLLGVWAQCMVFLYSYTNMLTIIFSAVLVLHKPNNIVNYVAVDIACYTTQGLQLLLHVATQLMAVDVD